ncbi:hypothetical protein AB4037_08665 [Labrys sp. KB_33_2]|uniref:hypothetical protein n=1 Tax=Labrys sp. KB_33_2 TaxID=3237479 RepID=UPI003F8E7971
MTTLSRQKSDLVHAFRACLCELALDLGYQVSKRAGGNDTIAIERNRLVCDRNADLLVSMTFHGADFFLAVTIDPVGWDQKTSPEIDDYFQWANQLRANGIGAFHFTGTEIRVAVGLCADQAINSIIDFQTGRIIAAAAGLSNG